MVRIVFPQDFDPSENCIYELRKIKDNKSSIKIEDPEQSSENINCLYDNSTGETIYHQTIKKNIEIINELEKLEKKRLDKNQNNNLKNSRYHNDPIYRRKFLDQQKAHKKWKYDNDPEYKKLFIERVANSKKKKKEKDLELSFKEGFEKCLQNIHKT